MLNLKYIFIAGLIFGYFRCSHLFKVQGVFNFPNNVKQNLIIDEDESFEIAQSEKNKLKIKVAQPKPLKDVIILDAGHGYIDGGGGRDGIYEHIPNARIIHKLATELVNTGYFEVYITHSLEYGGENLVFDNKINSNYSNVHILLPEIKKNKNNQYEGCYKATFLKDVIDKTVNCLRKWRSKIYSMSVHHNTRAENLSNNDERSGMQVYYFSNLYSNDSLNFGKNIFSFCKNLYGKSNYGFEPICDKYFVTQVGCPALLCEIDFIDNVVRRNIIVDDKHQTRMVKGLKNAILKTYGYVTNWANLEFYKNKKGDRFKIDVKNISANATQLIAAVYDKSITNPNDVLWVTLKKQNNIWSGEFDKENYIKSNTCVDIYKIENEKFYNVETDFNEFRTDSLKVFEDNAVPVETKT